MHIVSEPMTGASSVWNAMLGVWNEVKLQPGWDPSAVSPMLGTSDFPIKVGELGGTGRGRAGTDAPAPAAPIGDGAAAAPQVTRGVLDAARGRQALASLLKLDGLLGCALVDGDQRPRPGARDARPSSRSTWSSPRPRARRCCAPIATSARSMGLADPIDEVITTAGSRHVLIRALQRHADLFLVALLEKHRTNLALARFQLLEVERSLRLSGRTRAPLRRRCASSAPAPCWRAHRPSRCSGRRCGRVPSAR